MGLFGAQFDQSLCFVLIFVAKWSAPLFSRFFYLAITLLFPCYLFWNCVVVVSSGEKNKIHFSIFGWIYFFEKKNYVDLVGFFFVFTLFDLQHLFFFSWFCFCKLFVWSDFFLIAFISFIVDYSSNMLICPITHRNRFCITPEQGHITFIYLLTLCLYREKK